MGRVAGQLFQVSPEMFNRVQASAVGGPLKSIQRIILLCLGCVLRVVVLLEGEPSPQPEVLSALEQVFIKDLSLYFAQFQVEPFWVPGKTLSTERATWNPYVVVYSIPLYEYMNTVLNKPRDSIEQHVSVCARPHRARH
jgi:hypothetical protein